MRFGLEASSSSELSAADDNDDYFHDSSVAPLPTASTPRKGILRRSAAVATPQATHKLVSTPRPSAHFDPAPSQPSTSNPRHTSRQRTTPASSSSRAATSSTSQRYRRKESPFERVGLPPAQGSSPTTAGSSRRTSASASASLASPLPPWLRPEQAPRASISAARRLINDESFSSSSDDDGSRSGSSDGNASSTSLTTSSADGSDSEEEQWPVEPGKVGRGIEISGSSAARQPRSHSRRKRDLARRIRLASVADDWEDWDRLSRESALSRATSSYVYRLRSFTAPPEEQTLGNTGQSLRSRPLSSRTIPDLGPAPVRNSSAAANDNDDEDLYEVRRLLSTLNVKREDEEKREKEAFEARNRLLWQGIDASILAAEREAHEAAAAEAHRLATARKAQEEAEQRAKEEREREQKKIEDEKRANEEEAVKQEEEERQRAEAEAQQQAEKEKAMGGAGDGIRRAADKEHEMWMAKINHIKQSVLPTISQNPELRKQCFAAKRQITPKVGQLTNSQQEIARITNAISSVLSSAKAASSTGEIYTWILNHLSKCLVRQAEQEVAVKQDSAYPLARVVVWLLLEGHTELGEVLMARLAKKCCWCLAVWPGKRKEQDNESYRKALGYRSNEESNENYSNRMAGIFAFYVAILQTKPSAPPSSPPGSTPDLSLIPEHLRSKTLWTWSVRTLSTASPILSHPLLPSLWSNFLEVGGNRALDLYGRQMAKVWRLMLDEGVRGKKAGFVQKGEEEGYVKASIVRLQLLLEGWEKEGRIKDATKGVEMEQP